MEVDRGLRIILKQLEKADLNKYKDKLQRVTPRLKKLFSYERAYKDNFGLKEIDERLNDIRWFDKDHHKAYETYNPPLVADASMRYLHFKQPNVTPGRIIQIGYDREKEKKEIVAQGKTIVFRPGKESDEDKAMLFTILNKDHIHKNDEDKPKNLSDVKSIRLGDLKNLGVFNPKNIENTFSTRNGVIKSQLSGTSVGHIRTGVRYDFNGSIESNKESNKESIDSTIGHYQTLEDKIQKYIEDIRKYGSPFEYDDEFIKFLKLNDHDGIMYHILIDEDNFKDMLELDIQPTYEIELSDENINYFTDLLSHYKINADGEDGVFFDYFKKKLKKLVEEDENERYTDDSKDMMDLYFGFIDYRNIRLEDINETESILSPDKKIRMTKPKNRAKKKKNKRNIINPTLYEHGKNKNKEVTITDGFITATELFSKLEDKYFETKGNCNANVYLKDAIKQKTHDKKEILKYMIKFFTVVHVNTNFITLNDKSGNEDHSKYIIKNILDKKIDALPTNITFMTIGIDDNPEFIFIDVNVFETDKANIIFKLAHLREEFERNLDSPVNIFTTPDKSTTPSNIFTPMSPVVSNIINKYKNTSENEKVEKIKILVTNVQKFLKKPYSSTINFTKNMIKAKKAGKSIQNYIKNNIGFGKIGSDEMDVKIFN